MSVSRALAAANNSFFSVPGRRIVRCSWRGILTAWHAGLRASVPYCTQVLDWTKDGQYMRWGGGEGGGVPVSVRRCGKPSRDKSIATNRDRSIGIEPFGRANRDRSDMSTGMMEPIVQKLF